MLIYISVSIYFYIPCEHSTHDIVIRLLWLSMCNVEIIESNFFKKQNMINLLFFKHALYSASSHASSQMKSRIKMAWIKVNLISK